MRPRLRRPRTALLAVAAVLLATLPALAGPALAGGTGTFRVLSERPVLTERLAAPLTADRPALTQAPDRTGWARTGTGATRSTWQVTYDAGFRADAAARAQFQRAVDTWAGLVGSSVPITVDAHFASLGPRVLGSAGPGGFVEQVRDGRYTSGEGAYPVALGNALAGRDLIPATSSTGGFDVVAYFPSDNPSIYYGAGPVPPDRYDFFSTALHELGHGLGFTSSFDAAGGTGTWGLLASQPYLLPFDRLLTLGSDSAAKDLVALPSGSTELGSALTSRDVYWRGSRGVAAAGGARPKMYAPSPYQDGSSIAHLDEATYPPGSADALMTPAGAPGEQNLDVGDIALGILADLGWSVPVRSVPSTGPPSPGSRFTPAAPHRLLDTRTGLGAPTGRVGAGGSVDLPVTGGATGVPADATAVVLNVTAVGASRSTDVRVYPTPVDDAVPLVSTLNLAAGQTRAAVATVPVGAGGRVRLRNAAGSVSLLADLAGFYSPGGRSAFHAVDPVRLLDTRDGAVRTLGPGDTLDVAVGGAAGVPADASAAVLTLTAVGATRSTDVAVYPATTSAAAPETSNVNLVPGAPVPNLVVVALGDEGRVRVRNSGGQVSVLVDLAGWFGTGDGGALFHPVAPVRLLDTRDEPVAADRRLGPGDSGTLTVTSGPAAVPGTATAVLLNVTGVGASAGTDVRVYPRTAAGTVPVVSNLNLAAGQTAADAVLVGVGAGGGVVLRNSGGTVALLADLAGWFGP